MKDGGNSEKEATGCSGGRRDNGCFSARFMWRREGAGEIYTYLPPGSPENKAVCKVPPQSECNDVYGASVGRGSFKFTPGKRNTIGQREPVRKERGVRGCRDCSRERVWEFSSAWRRENGGPKGW